MATPSIGSISFAVMRGFVPPVAMAVADISREGIDGNELKQLGLRGAVVTLETVADFATAILARAHIAACMGLQGDDPMTVTYADGTTTSNVLVLRVVPGNVKAVPMSAGGLGSGKYIVRCSFECQQTTAEA